MGNVVPFPGKQIPKFGFKRVLRRKSARMEVEGQLNLFRSPERDAGIGFGKLLGVPGQSGNLRLYVAHQILDGQRDAGWRVLLAFEK